MNYPCRDFSVAPFGRFFEIIRCFNICSRRTPIIDRRFKISDFFYAQIGVRWSRVVCRPSPCARDGSGYAAKGRMSFCAADRGSRRKRPWRRQCKSQRTQAAFERTARPASREHAAGRAGGDERLHMRTQAPGRPKNKEKQVGERAVKRGLKKGLVG